MIDDRQLIAFQEHAQDTKRIDPDDIVDVLLTEHIRDDDVPVYGFLYVSNDSATDDAHCQQCEMEPPLVFGFSANKDFPYASSGATISPAKHQAILDGKVSMPNGMKIIGSLLNWKTV